MISDEKFSLQSFVNPKTRKWKTMNKNEELSEEQKRSVNNFAEQLVKDKKFRDDIMSDIQKRLLRHNVIYYTLMGIVIVLDVITGIILMRAALKKWYWEMGSN